ncbi:nucleoside monophosphate kinase [Candidatus Woesebacteria bacterium]|nr:nucleoside monophosphate kinase [Candidatus Woesebacteria bacterium]
MNLLILGPQGSGKGTQALLLAKEFGLVYLDMGAFLRELAGNDAQIDRLINKEGKLLSDEVTFDIFRKFLEANPGALKKGLMLDGFPRTPGQFERIKKYFKEKGTRLDRAIALEVSEEISIQRLSSRRICEKCGTIYNLITNPPPGEKCECGGNLVQREDDTPGAIKRRLALYRQRTEPLIGLLEKEGILIRVNGEREIEEISKDTVGKIKE